MNLKNLAGDVGVGDSDHMKEAHAHMENSAVAGGEIGESTVGELVHHQHIADEGEAFWAGWKRQLSPETSEQRSQQKQKRECEKECHIERLKKRLRIHLDFEVQENISVGFYRRIVAKYSA